MERNHRGFEATRGTPQEADPITVLDAARSKCREAATLSDILTEAVEQRQHERAEVLAFDINDRLHEMADSLDRYAAAIEGKAGRT